MALRNRELDLASLLREQGFRENIPDARRMQDFCTALPVLGARCHSRRRRLGGALHPGQQCQAGPGPMCQSRPRLPHRIESPLVSWQFRDL